MISSKYYKILKNKNILVTGGAGFIGSNICEFLVKNDLNVVCLDNLSTGDIDNISNYFKFIEGDIRDLETCQLSCKNIDFVLHQAALGSVPRSIEDPLNTNSVNISGFLNMLIASRDNNVTRFVFAASSSTYGDSKILPKVEEKIGNPLSPYAITKFVNELYAKIFNDIYKLDYIGLRYFNVFGRRQDPNGAYAAVIPKFIKLILKNENPIINGDGSYSRDFTYIDNVIQINLLSIITTNQESLNQIYNVACGKSITLNELGEYIKKTMSNFDKKFDDVVFKHGPVRVGDVPHSLACIKKARRLLKYKPEFDVINGLEESIKWYIDNLK